MSQPNAGTLKVPSDLEAQFLQLTMDRNALLKDLLRIRSTVVGIAADMQAALANKPSLKQLTVDVDTWSLDLDSIVDVETLAAFKACFEDEGEV